MTQFKFSSNVLTDASGFQQLANFYNSCKAQKNCYVTINMESVRFFDANLSSAFLALAHKLMKENNLKFFIDYKVFSNASLGVLKRNGLAKLLCNHSAEVYDNRESVIPVRFFNIDDADGFVNYIDRDLFRHRGVENVSYGIKKKLKDSYCEIFDNVGIHANTSYPILACGQYYPTQKELKFTLVDLGDGFFKKIKDHTAGSAIPVTIPAQAISWAVRGGSTKSAAVGGNGLKNIFKFDGVVTSHTIRSPFVGATVSLIFRDL
jgi:hypothetical protein